MKTLFLFLFIALPAPVTAYAPNDTLLELHPIARNNIWGVLQQYVQAYALIRPG